MPQTNADTDKTNPLPQHEPGFCRVGSPCWWRRVFLFFTAVTGYILLFIGGLPVVGGGISVLAVIPAMVGGWFFRILGGVLLGAFLILLNVVLFTWYPDPFSNPTASGNVQGIPITFVILATGAASGWVRQLVNRANRQAAELRREQVALKHEIEERIAAEAALAHIQQT
ncbi:MAG: hypothetical protein D6768_06160, partial [Chloroflexi bacterium]